MNNDENDYEIKYNLDSIVTEIESATNQKAVKDQIFTTTYLMGNVNEDDLISVGFKCFGKANRGGYDTYIYRLGNIEAVFIDQILHICEVTSV